MRLLAEQLESRCVPTLAITTPTLPNWDQQLGFSQTINTSGGVGPLTFSSSGTLPPGLTLSTGGVLAGMPSAIGSYAFTITATDSTSAIASQSYTLTISPRVTITTTSLPDWTVDQPNYGRLIATSGGQENFSFSVTDTSPPGLTVGAVGANGTGITGTPTSIGTFTFTVTATDIINGSASQTFTVAINPPVVFPVKTIATFTSPNPANPTSLIVESGTGNLFGTTPSAVFEVKAGSSNITTMPLSQPTGFNPSGPLFEDKNGDLFGTAANGGASLDGTVFVVRNDSNAVSLLANFNGANGSHPIGGLVEDSSGNLFGTTEYGGIGYTGQDTGYGTVFEIRHGGGPIIPVAAFNGSNGASPEGGLVLDGNGNLFGTTTLGGSANRGTLFEIPKGTTTITTLKSLTGSAPYSPTGSLIEDTNGSLIGTTTNNGYGTLFELPAGSTTFAFLSSFSGLNGAGPTGSLALDSEGDIFGTTDSGGPGLLAQGYGTVFEVPKGGGIPRTITLFSGPDGTTPLGGVVFDSSGNLFGTAAYGGIGFGGGNKGFGTVFEIVNALPSGTVNEPGYNQTLLATGGTGPLVFTESGTLPPGLVLSSSGVLTGTPTTSGTFKFTVTATDAAGAKAGHSYSLVINPALTITTTSLADAMVGDGYNQTIGAVNAVSGTGTITFSITAGALPTGLTLSSAGVLSGIPLEVGSYNFTLTATDSTSNTASQAYMLTIFSYGLSPNKLPDWTVSQPGYNETLTTAGGVAASAFSLKTGTLPPGLTLASNGVITGEPVVVGGYKFTVLATDSMGDLGEESFSLTISPNPTITTTALATWTAGLGGYSQQISVTDGTGSASVAIGTGNLPAGLTLSTGGILSGTPMAAGSFTFTVSATDITDASITQTYTLIINPPISLPSSVPSGTAGISYMQLLMATGGTGRLSFSWIGSLPPGLRLNGSGSLFGTPTTSGTYYFTATVNDRVGATASQSYSITIVAGPFAQYLINVIGAGPLQAGNSFLATVQAEDAYGNPVTSYTGPTSVTVSSSPVATSGSFPASVSLDNSGSGFFLATLQKTGTYHISVSGGPYSGSSPALTVTSGPAVKLAFAGAPGSIPTGDILQPVSVQVEDLYGNVVTSDNSDMVTLGIASGPGSFTAGSTTTVAVHKGVATFTNLTLVNPGVYQFNALVPQLYTGPNSASLTVTALQVVPGSFSHSSSGFSVQFDAPYLVDSLTPVLYGAGLAGNAPVPSVTVTQIRDGGGNPVNIVTEGSLVLNPADNGITFLATNTAYEANNGSPVLPDGTYVVVVHSSLTTDGFQALNPGGGFLDGLGTGIAGSGDFTTTFTVNAAASDDDIVWIPATADGPGQPLNAPGANQSGGGYPIYLSDTTGAVTDVQVTLNYNAALLTVTGVTGAGFTLLSSSTPGQAVLEYNGAALPTGSQVPLGSLLATVPGGSAADPTPYRAKDLLHLSNIKINGGGIAAVGSDALHLVAYVGDGDGNGSYSSGDAVLVTRAGLQSDSGFAAYPLVDPVIVADTDGSGFIPADAALQVNEAGVNFATANLPSPPVPPGAVFQPVANNVDPVLSLEPRDQSSEPGRGGIVTAVVNIDDANPAGSTGLVEGHLALTYDPRQFTVSADDVHAGSVLAGGNWSVVPTIDPATGQIGIALSGSTPVISTLGGSLVTIDFHRISNEPGALATGAAATPVAYAPGSSIALVASVTPNGQLFTTELEDAQGTFILTPAPGNRADTRDTIVMMPPPTAVVGAEARTITSDPVQVVIRSADSAEVDGPVSTAPGEALASESSAHDAAPPAEIQVSAGRDNLHTVVAAASSAIISTISSTAGLMLPFGSTALVSGQASTWQPLADQFFQALVREAVSLSMPFIGPVARDILDRSMPGAVLQLPGNADSLNGMNWEEAGIDLDAQAPGDSAGQNASKRPTHCASTSPAPEGEADLDQASVDRYFAAEE
jgi:uncharacterized repeat protein (TIGR03803 family)